MAHLVVRDHGLLVVSGLEGSITLFLERCGLGDVLCGHVDSQPIGRHHRGRPGIPRGATGPCAAVPPALRPNELPPNFDANLSLETMQWACGLAYCPEVAARLQLANDGAPNGAPVFHATLDGTAFCRIKDTLASAGGKSGKQLLVAMRGTVFGMIDDMLRNVEGFGTSIHSVFSGDRAAAPWGPFAARAHRMYLDRAMGVLFNWLMLEVAHSLPHCLSHSLMTQHSLTRSLLSLLRPLRCSVGITT
jgi:hypothetical protein